MQVLFVDEIILHIPRDILTPNDFCHFNNYRIVKMIEELLVNKSDFQTVKPIWNIFDLISMAAKAMKYNCKMIIIEAIKVKYSEKNLFNNGFIFLEY